MGTFGRSCFCKVKTQIVGKRSFSTVSLAGGTAVPRQIIVSWPAQACFRSRGQGRAGRPTRRRGHGTPFRRLRHIPARSRTAARSDPRGAAHPCRAQARRPYPAPEAVRRSGGTEVISFRRSMGSSRYSAALWATYLYDRYGQYADAWALCG